ncbi:hypothetical protein PMZ80_005640 [Knufia obscura]|uniref:Uncharacterized protein n=1 Tax=Knufia obscura TaxID=1635080 RepID=A0ABR0RN43_9EURO|nr:hypothetical protein PMZ80_005640 [Knufia obscura]
MDRTFSQLGLPKEGSLARGKYNSLEYHVQTKHPQHDQTRWAELKLMKDAKFGKPSARYECALCDDGKVYHQKAETSSRKSVATLEGHVKEVHPAWEDDFLVLAIDKRAKPKQGSVSTGPGKDEKNPESRQTSVEAGTGEDENSHS